MPDRDMEISETIGYRIRHLAALMARQARISLRQKVGLPQAQWRVLVQLAVGGAQNPNALARELDLKRSHITLAARALRRRRLVSQTADRADGRRVLLSLTMAGHELVRHGTLAHAPRRARLVADLTEGERDALDSALRKLTRTLEQMLAEAGEETAAG